MPKILSTFFHLIPQPWKNIIMFFRATLKNVDSKEELLKIGETFKEILADGQISSQEWMKLGGPQGLNILGKDKLSEHLFKFK
tara:strand:+ start:494 stop:742 length:249 start_codon:yes stop_codon:yes gene_type:complete